MDAISHALVVFGASTRGAYDLPAGSRDSGSGMSADGGGMQGGLHDDHDHAVN